MLYYQITVNSLRFDLCGFWVHGEMLRLLRIYQLISFFFLFLSLFLYCRVALAYEGPSVFKLLLLTFQFSVSG
ncbi:hypothetical protein ACFX2J_017187 [Malus domestica]